MSWPVFYAIKGRIPSAGVQAVQLSKNCVQREKEVVQLLHPQKILEKMVLNIGQKYEDHSDVNIQIAKAIRQYFVANVE